MGGSFGQRTWSRIMQFQPGEAGTAFLMLAYSFLAMASYNMIKPITRSKFIKDLGADDVPYMVIAAAVLIGIIMLGYAWLMARLPRRWNLPIVQALAVAILAGFGLLFRTDQKGVSILFYLFGLILGILLISQFWTLANLVYDPRQAKRLFGFIGAGASLGGLAGSLVTTRYVKTIGSNDIVLISAGVMAACATIVVVIIMREGITTLGSGAEQERGVTLGKALELLRGSKHLQLIAMVITFAAIGANVIEQQLLMAAQATKGQESAIAGFLAEIQAWTSGIGFLIQLFLTSRIHRMLGIGFALMILPFSFGSTALIMLLNAALWAPGLARVLDQSLRYTVDKTTREILFMPLAADIKLQAKPFVDVTVDRFGKGLAGVVCVVLIKVLHLNWQQISYASVSITLIWIFMALRARRGYVEAFRRSIESRDIKAGEVRLAVADLSTIEALVQELASPDEKRVLYAIDILESLDKQNLVSPLLLYHESAAVRARALGVLGALPREAASRWVPKIRLLMGDPSPDVRMASIGALANIEDVQLAELVRPQLKDPNPRIAMTAAMMLAGSPGEADRAAAEEVLEQLAADPRDSAVETRRDVAAVLRQVPDPRFRRLLVPLLADNNLEVAEEALNTLRAIGPSDYMFVPELISLLRHPRLKGAARELLVGYGEPVLDILGHFLQDPEEELTIRRHIPETIARIPSNKSVELLCGALEDADGYLRFRALVGLERLRRSEASLQIPRAPVETMIFAECDRVSHYVELCRECVGDRMPVRGRLLARALSEKCERAADRIFRLLGLVHSWKDIASARQSFHAGGAMRARALEYLDNVLPGAVRKRVLPTLEQFRPLAVAVSAAEPAVNEGVVRALLQDRDAVIAAATACVVRERKLPGFSGDLERLAAARDRSGCVTDAASWALGRSDITPSVEIASRLSSLPLFAGVSVDELFGIACAGRQVSYAPGAGIYGNGKTPEDLQILIKGNVVRQAPSGEVTPIEAPAPLDFEEVLKEVPVQGTVTAATDSVCLSLTFKEMRSLMADSSGLLEGMLRMLCLHADACVADPIVHPVVPAGFPSEQLDPVNRATLLASYPVFSAISRDEMLKLAAVATTLRLEHDAELFGVMDVPALYAVASGSVTVEGDGEPPSQAAAGDAIGLYQMITGIPIVRRAQCTAASTVLRVDREDFVDLLMQRPDFLHQLLVALFVGNGSEQAAKYSCS